MISFLLLGPFLPFRLMNDENIYFFRTTTEKFRFSIVTTTGFPLQVSFAHQLEKSKLGVHLCLQVGLRVLAIPIIGAGLG